MIDLHTHTFLSDGVLTPSELVQRASVRGYRALGLTDHVDAGTLRPVLAAVLRTCGDLAGVTPAKPLPGVEITHVPPPLIGALASRARRYGAHLVVVHGETLVEPVAEGTNRAAVEADIDLLAHPGLVEERILRRAADRGIYLELSARAGHSLGNGHLVSLARQLDALEWLVVSSDTHTPSDLLSDARRRAVCRGAGLSSTETTLVERNAERLLKKVER